MRIGELARRTGSSVRMLRFYEAQGLLAPARTAAGYRDYVARDLVAVDTIRLLGRAGMTLTVIRRFLPCTLDERGSFEPCEELRQLLGEQIMAVDARAAALDESREALTTILKRL